MSKVLVKFGGTRVGDMLHSIPLLLKLKENSHEVHLVHAGYEAQAVELLQHLGLVDHSIRSHLAADVVPSDMKNIVNFMRNSDNLFEPEDYDAIVSPKFMEDDPEGLNGEFESTKDIGIDFTTCPWASAIIPDVRVGNYVREDDYIGVQAATISTFKIYSPLYVIDYPGDVKSFGFEADKPIPNAIKVHGKTLVEVYEELMTCCMVATTHSTIGVLAYYLGIPQIFIHFWPKVGAHLVQKEHTISLDAPEKSDLEQSIADLYRKLN